MKKLLEKGKGLLTKVKQGGNIVTKTTQENMSGVGNALEGTIQGVGQVVEGRIKMGSDNIFTSIGGLFDTVIGTIYLGVHVPYAALIAIRNTLGLPYDILVALRNMPSYGNMMGAIDEGIKFLEGKESLEESDKEKVISLLEKVKDSFNHCLTEGEIESEILLTNQTERRFNESINIIEDQIQKGDLDANSVFGQFLLMKDVFGRNEEE